MPQEELNAVVTQRLEVTPDLVILRVVPDGWELPTFEAGQFGVIGLPPDAPRTEYSDPVEDYEKPQRGLIRRAYSIASSSVATEYLEFYITLVRSGALTPRLFALEIGDRLWLGPKITGMFTLQDVPPNKNVVMVATGTGLAPYMSMLRTYLRENTERRFVVLHGARHSWDLGYRSELEMMQDLCANFIYIPQISRPANEHVAWSGHTGYVQNLWTDGPLDEVWGGHPTPEDTHVFVCGNPYMCEDVTNILVAESFKEHKRRDPGQVHIERYW